MTTTVTLEKRFWRCRTTDHGNVRLLSLHHVEPLGEHRFRANLSCGCYVIIETSFRDYLFDRGCADCSRVASPAAGEGP